MLRVVLGGASPDDRGGDPRISPASPRSTSSPESGAATTYDVTTQAGASADVQRSITRFAVDAGLTLISNSEETLDLETVFLRLIDQKEVAA